MSVFERVPQFGIYSDKEPDYTPPSGVLSWNYGTVFLAKLSVRQQPEGSAFVTSISFSSP